MHIAFITPYSSRYSNVARHALNRLTRWEESGLNVTSLLLGHPNRRGRSALSNLASDVVSSDTLVHHIRKSNLDLVYLRWFVPLPGFLARLSKYVPIVLEIHASDLIEPANTPIRTIYTELFRERELGSASGACFMTESLRMSDDFEILRSIPSLVFPNGTNLSIRNDVPVHTKPIVGIAVGNTGARAGLREFRRLADQLNGVRFVVACQPDIASAVKWEVGSGVEVRVNESESAYLRELTSWTVALGPLDLELSGHLTATPLKVRDYLGLGIPTVTPYIDEGLVNVDDPAVAQLASEDKPFPRIDPQWLTRFVQQMEGRNILPSTAAHVSLSAIEARRVAFLKTIASDSITKRR